MSNVLPTCELNMRCAGVKRLLKEAYELRVPNELFFAKPMEDNLFEWHFTIRGSPDTVYEKGIYHGRIILPAEYPMKPPSLILLTPNGRFETNKKICLSISGYHSETWLPSWSIRTALLALIGFMPTHSAGAIGGLECSEQERKKLALKSLDWRCNVCDCAMKDVLPLLDKPSPVLLKEMETASKGILSSQSSNSNLSKDTNPIIKESSLASSLEESQAFNKNNEFKNSSDKDTSLTEKSNSNESSSLPSLPSSKSLNITSQSSNEPIESASSEQNSQQLNDENNLRYRKNNSNAIQRDSSKNSNNQHQASFNWFALLWILICSLIFIALLYRRLSLA